MYVNEKKAEHQISGQLGLLIMRL